MPSIIEGYNYDIFISYRQKDNKHDSWVSEFVDQLKGELESTFKEEISVYFDINPHDGLLETHDVDESLKEKLKCLVFIPILSRTYCDPKAFAWEHEFKAFINQASQDKFGLKIKLPTGNVANRVLPVRIHDLDPEDIELCESILGGVLRGIEFIYKEPGVNRSLTPKDHEKKNLNNTNYRNQINKVALAIREIIQGIKAEPAAPQKDIIGRRKPVEEARKEEKTEVQERPAKTSRRKLLAGSIIIAVLFAVAALLAYPKIFKQDKIGSLKSSDGKIPIAVMPFQNLTNDTANNFWQEGIQEILTTSLANATELKVKQTESINSLIQSKGFTNYASVTPSVASSISKKLDANVFVYGNLIRSGNAIRLNAQLINSKTEDIFKSFQINGTPMEIMSIIDSLSVKIRDFLVLYEFDKSTKHAISSRRTNSPLAYKYYGYAMSADGKGDKETANKWFLEAISIDSNFIEAINNLTVNYISLGLYDQAKKWCLKLSEKKGVMTMWEKLNANRHYAQLFESPIEEIKYLKQALETEQKDAPIVHNSLGGIYNSIYQYNNAILEFEKSLEIYKKINSIPPNWVYQDLGKAYHKTGLYKKEKKLYKKAENKYPEDPWIIRNQSILSLSEGDTKEADKYIEKFKLIRKKNLISEAAIASNLAWIYSEAGMLDKAEEYYREALALEPNNPARINYLSWFLIDKDRNVNEGLELNDKLFELFPQYDYVISDHKGWGLYKQGKYQEALEILQKSWDIRREKAIYDHEAFLHLEEANKAVASQK